MISKCLVFAVFFVRCGLAAVCTTEDYTGHEKALTKKDTFEGGNFNRGHLMLDSLYTVPCCGEVQQWEMYVEQPGRVQLQIWRGTASGYQLVGQNNFTLTSAGLKEQYLPIIPEQRIQVQANDVIGWATPDDEIIPYKREGSGSLVIQESMADVAVGGEFDWSTGTLINKRYYAIKAILAPGNGPEMSAFPTSITLSHTTALGTIIYTPVLTSMSGTFSLSSSGEFAIDINSGVVTLSAPMAVGSYSLSVSVTDSCGRSQTQSFIVISTNDAPTISGLPFSNDLHENTILETSLHTFSTTDNDGDSFTCAIENTFGIFLLKSNLTGSIIGYEIYSKSSPGLSYAAVSTYTLNISCSDGIDTSSEIFIVYILQNVAPSFTNLPSSTTISAKSTLIGTTVYSVQYSDPDSSSLTLSSSCSPLPCPFSVASDGTITCTTDLKGETTVSYSLEFHVKDSLVSTGPGTLTIHLSALNTAPVIQNLPQTLFISEHLYVASLIYHISVYDPDVTDVLSTTFTVQPSSGALLFETNTTDLTVHSGASLNYEALTAYNYTIYVAVSDGIFSDASYLTISVLDENEPPNVNLDTYYITVDEGQKDTPLPAVGFVVTDEDIGDSYTYAITDGPNFVINATTGVISFAMDTEVTVTSTFNITVQVTDSGGLFDTCVVVVTIRNVNRKPYFTNLPVTLSFPENTASGTQLYVLGVVDESLASTSVSCSITPVLATNLFSYNDTDRKLNLVEGFNFDYETTTMYNLTFEANDGSITSDSAILCLEITNVNEAPKFQSPVYYITFNENASGSTFPSIAYNVNDPDAGDTLTYSLLTGDFVTKLGIDSGTGQMHLTADLYIDYTLSTNTTVQVTDMNGLSSTAVVEMTIVNVNRVPYFLNLPFTLNVAENIPSGTVVYDVTARDDDTTDVLTYTVAFVPTYASALLQFDSTGNTIKLRDNATLNYQLLNQVVASVTVQDLSGATVTSNLTVNIDNVNQPPVFSSNLYFGEVDDGTLGLPVTVLISATDPDITDVLSYSIVSQSTAGIFSINTTSGELSTAVDDAYYRTFGNCTLLVQVQDQFGAYDQTTVVITVNHVNTRPEIANFTGSYEISEALPVGSLLSIFSVTDPDSPDIITKRISWDPASGVDKFTLSFSSRQLYIYLNEAVDYEVQSSYNLTLIFNDGYEDSPSYQVAYSVGDVNEVPSFQYNTYNVKVNESDAGTIIDFDVVYSDPDVGDTTTCEIFSGNDNLYFDILSSTCALSLAKNYDIDTSLPSTHSLIVKVVDSKGLSATTSVNIEVLDINDNAPQFEGPELVEFVYSDSLIGSQVQKLSVSDKDSSLNAQLTCSMDSSHAASQFALAGDCTIYQTESLEGIAEGSEINFTAVVKDAGNPSLSSTALVRIIIQGTEKPATTAVSSGGLNFTDWEVLLICGAIGLVGLLGLINAVMMYRKGCCKKLPTGKDSSKVAEKNRVEDKPEERKSRPNSSQNARRKTRRAPSLPLTTPKMETVSVSNARCEDLERILTPTDISFNDGFETGRSSISSDRSFPSFPRPSRRISDVLGPRSNFDYV